MENLNNREEQDRPKKEAKRNETPGLSLEGMESKISMLTNHNDTSASDGFRAQLKARVLEAHARNNMPRFSFKALFSMFKVSRLTVAIAVFLIAAVAGGAFLSGFLPGGGGKLARVFISPAYAADDFSLAPLAADSTGVTPDSVYKLTSKEAFATAAIKTGLSFSPDIKATVTAVSDKEWMIKPTVSLPANSLLRISLAAQVNDNGTLLARDFSWAFQVKDNFRVLNTLPGNAGKGVPVTTGVEVTFSHADLDGYEKSFAISPTVAGRFEQHGRTYVFVPNQPLQPSELYTVTVSGNLGPVGSQEKLGQDYVFGFETAAAADNAPSKWFGVNSAMLQFTPDENPYLQVYGDATMQTSVNLYSFPSFNSFRAALDARDKYPAWSEKWNNYRYDTSQLVRIVSFSPKIETQNYANLISFPSRLPAGFYLAEVAYENKVASVLIEVNDLNVIYNIDASRMLVWANRPSTGAALVGASIAVGDVSAAATTDGNGAAAFDIPAAYRAAAPAKPLDKPVYMTVTAGDALALTELTFGAAGIDSRWAYFYTDRPRYQTDDMLNFWAMTRDRADASVSTGKYSVVLRKGGWYDYFYNPVKIAEVAITPDAYGTVTGQIPLKGLRPDSYEVVLTLDGKDVISRSITVLPYVKPAYSISVTADRSAAFAGEQINFTGEARFFDGTPAAGIKMKAVTGGAMLGSFTTDEQGKIYFSDTKQYNALDLGGAVSGYYTVAPVSAELGDISGAVSATWYGSHYYTSTDVVYPSAGRGEFDFLVRKVDLNKINSQGASTSWSWNDDWRGSEPAAGAAISGDLYKTTYVRVETGTAYDFINKTSYKTYRYDRHEDKIDSLTLVSGADGKARYPFATEKDATYRLAYKVMDTAGREESNNAYAYYYDGAVYYGDYFPDSGSDRATIEFNRDDNTYSLGEKVKATLVSGNQPAPAGGVNRFLFAKYQNGLKSWQIQSAAAYEFAFSEKDIPNVQVFAAWWDGKNYHSARTDGWWGSVDDGAKYRYANRELTVSAALDKTSYAPGGTANLKLSVKDKNGRPVRAAVNVNLVDEAYYAIAEDTANPLAGIYTTQYSGLYVSQQTQLDETLGLATGLGAERGGCFAGGTLITMADGKTKPIQDIKIGDQVATLANPLNSEVVTGTVGAVFVHASNKMISINNGLLTATPEHMIYASGTFKTAGELRVGDVLVGLDGKKTAVDSIKTVFVREMVYNLRVDPYHTFIANGIYVHNDKDAAVRQNFVDTAIFRTVETDASGQATVNFQLPDNVTTWRLTTQAIGKDLSAGVSVNKIKATLPAFIDVTVGSEYLAGDQVTAKLRAFGTALTANDPVAYAVASPSLGNTPFQFNAAGQAYVPTEVAFPPLPVGDYAVTYSMTSAKGKDAVKLPLKAVKSHLNAYQVLSETGVAVGTNLAAPGVDGSVRVVFADGSTMRYYQILSSLSWSWGQRVDQALGHALAADLLLKYYNESGHENAFDGSLYQQGDGGLALLPYGSSDMDLSARLAALAPDKFDQGALRQYFLREIDAAKATPETVSAALLGLASLGDPILPRLQVWKMRADLNDESKMRTALALYKMGAAEDARQLYNEVAKNAEARGAYDLLAGDNKAATLAKTAFLAELAGALNMPERDKLWAYVDAHRADSQTEVLTNLEDLSFAVYTLPTVAPGPSSVSYDLNGVKDKINLNGWGNKTLTLAAADLPQLKITAVEGKVTASVTADLPIDQSGMVTSSEVSVSRTYSVNGKPTTDFNDGDIVRVELGLRINDNSPSRHYQVTDILPAGLIPATGMYSPYSGNAYTWLNPFDVDGQKVSFNIWKGGLPDWQGNNQPNPIFYYARVKTKGTYKAEPAVIQGFEDPATINFSSSQTVTVK